MKVFLVYRVTVPFAAKGQHCVAAEALVKVSAQGLASTNCYEQHFELVESSKPLLSFVASTSVTVIPQRAAGLCVVVPSGLS